MGVKISFYSALKAACRRIRYHFCVVTITFGCFFCRPCWIVTIVFTLPFALSPALPPTGRHSCRMNFLLMVLTNLFPTHTYTLSLSRPAVIGVRNGCCHGMKHRRQRQMQLCCPCFTCIVRIGRARFRVWLDRVHTENGTHRHCSCLRLFELHPIICSFADLP